MKKLAIIGAGGFGREVLWLVREINRFSLLKKKQEKYNIIGFIDDNKTLHNKNICDVPVLGSKEWLLDNRDVSAVCAIGSSRIKIKIINFLDENSIKTESIIHPSVQMSKYVNIGTGSIICSNVIMTTQIKIGKHVIINLNVTIGHDVEIGDSSTIYPGVNVSGDVNIGKGVELGTNSAIIQGINIGSGLILGAGAVVNKNLESNVVAVGIPAKAIKEIQDKILD